MDRLAGVADDKGRLGLTPGVRDDRDERGARFVSAHSRDVAPHQGIGQRALAALGLADNHDSGQRRAALGVLTGLLDDILTTMLAQDREGVLQGGVER